MYIKTTGVILGSIIITLLLTTFLLERESPQLKPGFIKLTARISDPIIGSEGKPIMAGVDPTPPPAIFY
ncbi:hypothetical protein HYT02_00185 [Candidatus Gottesmanbacteria bacterium]|nr:hypothetical protein [Candidatus Gottesmanbacteria bacterium]